MSMWEIESLVEGGINFVGSLGIHNQEKIKLIGNLFIIQSAFDCSFTHFRVMEVLLATGYTKTVQHTEHPDYKDNEAFFERLLRGDDISFVYRDISKEWSEQNEMVAYLERDSGLLYIDYGSPLRMGDPPLERVSVFEVGLLLVRAAHERGCRELVYDWTAFLLNIGPGFVDWATPVEGIVNDYFWEIRRIWAGYDYSDYVPLGDMLTVYSGRGEVPEHVEWVLEADNLRGRLLRWFIGF